MLWRIKWLAETAMIPIWLISEWLEERFSHSRDSCYKINPVLQKAVVAAQDASTALGIALVEMKGAGVHPSSLLQTAIDAVKENNVKLSDILGKTDIGV